MTKAPKLTFFSSINKMQETKKLQKGPKKGTKVLKLIFFLRLITCKKPKKKYKKYSDTNRKEYEKWYQNNNVKRTQKVIIKKLKLVIKLLIRFSKRKKKNL